jgi:hypothetical protein
VKYKLNPFEKLVLEILLMILMNYPHQMRSRLLSRINDATRDGEIEDAQ